MFRSENGWINQYKKRWALWIHNGDPQHPHALLTSGKHSSGFFNSGFAMQDSLLLHEASLDLIRLLKRHEVDITYIDRVVGPAMGAITLAHDLSCQIGTCRGWSCLCAYTEKELTSNGLTMAFKTTKICPGERVLIVEDVLVTGGSVKLTADAVKLDGGEVLPFVAVLVNRSGLTEVNGRKIVALINRPMPIWEPHDCPLCKEGSTAICPKDKENWAQLNAI